MNDKKKIITISREFGSGGRLIGRRLAEKMDVPYYARHKCMMKRDLRVNASRAGLDRQVVRTRRAYAISLRCRVPGSI